MNTALLSKIHGSLAAACIADALGAPTEELSRRQIVDAFGGYVTEFHPPLPGAPYAKGRAAAQITDDSSQMIMLAQLLINKGATLTPKDMADLLIEWSGNTDYFPHFAGPTTRARPSPARRRPRRRTPRGGRGRRRAGRPGSTRGHSRGR